MYTGEKLAALSNIIYSFAKGRLESSRLDPPLAEFVMRDVHRRFIEDAYHASLLRQVNEAERAARQAAEPPVTSEGE